MGDDCFYASFPTFTSPNFPMVTALHGVPPSRLTRVRDGDNFT
jgi:hypothetical protein